MKRRWWYAFCPSCDYESALDDSRSLPDRPKCPDCGAEAKITSNLFSDDERLEWNKTRGEE